MCTLYIAAIDNNQTKHYRFTCSSIYVLYTLVASIFKGTWSQEGTGGAEPAHTNHPNFHLKERLLNLRRRECFVCLPSYYFMPYKWGNNCIVYIFLLFLSAESKNTQYSLCSFK